MRQLLTSAGEYHARAERAEASASAARINAADADDRARRAEAGYEQVRQDALNRAIQVLDLTRSPERGEEIRGALALILMRQNIGAVKEHGDPDQLREIRIYDALLGEPETAGEPAADLQPGASAGDLEPQ